MTKKASSYLWEFYGPWEKNEPGQGERHWQKQRERDEKLGPPDVRKVAKKRKK